MAHLSVADVRAKYPQYAPYLDIPELAAIILDAVEREKDAAWVQGAIEATNWWRSRTESQRQWTRLTPAEQTDLVNRTIEKMVDAVRAQLGDVYINEKFGGIAKLRQDLRDTGAAWRVASGEELYEQWEVRSYQMAMSVEGTVAWTRYQQQRRELKLEQLRPEQILDQMVGDYYQAYGRSYVDSHGGIDAVKQEFTPIAQQIADGDALYDTWRLGMEDTAAKAEGTSLWAATQSEAQKLAAAVDQPATIADRVKERANAFLVGLDDAAAMDWGNKIASGAMSEQDFEDWVKGQAKAAFSMFEAAIDGGAELRTLLSPQLQVAAREMERSIDDVWNDASLMQPIIQGAAQGTIPTQSAYQKYIRSLPAWKATSGANELAADWNARLAKTFGVVG